MQWADDGGELPVPEPGAGGGRSGLVRPAAGADTGVPSLTLSLSDLLPDTNGEIVIVSAAGDSHLSIVTDLRVCDSGVAAQHVTADGFDVGGLAYYAFESGTRLYFSPDLDLTIAPADPG